MCCLGDKNPKASPGSDGLCRLTPVRAGDMTECSISHLVAHGNGQKRGKRREASYRRKITMPKA